MEPQIRYARTDDGVSIAYAAMGDGDWLVYSTNIWGDLQHYIHNEGTRRQVDWLVEAGWRVLRYDGRGMGASDRDVDDLSLATRVLDLEAVVEDAGVSQFALCGYGQGGPAAILFSRRHAERVSHLVLVNSFAKGSEYYNSNPLARTLVSIQEVAESEFEFFTLALANAGNSFSDSEAGRAMAKMMRGAMTPAAALAYVDAARNIDVLDELPGVSVSTLVVDDTAGMLTGNLNRVLASSIPKAVFLRSDNYVEDLDRFVRGAPRQRPASADSPSSFRTILLTDVVSSTPLLTQLGDARMRKVMRDHDAVMEAAVTGHGGRVVKTIGDAFMAEFAVPSNAVAAAIDAQQRIRNKFRSSDVPIRIRIGINAGEPIAEAGDLHGASVVIAKRLESAADTNGILVSEVVKQMVAGKDFDFEDRGLVELKGFEEPTRAWAVLWEQTNRERQTVPPPHLRATGCGEDDRGLRAAPPDRRAAGPRTPPHGPAE